MNDLPNAEFQLFNIYGVSFPGIIPHMITNILHIAGNGMNNRIFIQHFV